MKNTKSIRYKITTLILSVSLSALSVLGIVTFINIFVMKQGIEKTNNQLGVSAAQDSTRALETETLEKLRVITKTISETTEEKLGKIETYAQLLSDNATAVFSNPAGYQPMEIHPPTMQNKDKLALYYIYPDGQTRDAVMGDAAMAANCKALLYGIPNVDSAITACYISFDSGLHVVADTASAARLAPEANYDPRTRDWFKTAKRKNSVTFSDVMDDAQGRGLGIVCSAPFFDAGGNAIGVVGVGALLSDINEMVLNIDLGVTGSAFIMNERGQIIISPDIQKDRFGKIIRENMLVSPNPKLQEIAVQMLGGEAGVMSVDWKGTPAYMAYHPLKSVGWSIATTVSTKEAMALSDRTLENITQFTNNASTQINRSIFLSILVTFIVMALATCYILSIGTRASTRLTIPLKKLTESVDEISGGNLDFDFDIHTGDEIESLAMSFTSMTRELKEYMANLTSVTAEKERIGTELGVATHIQASMLPCIFPAFPGRPEFDIYATMTPAKEVGGDFYDFFLVDDDHLAMVMADVSGKGVPAALFMVIAKTLVKNIAQTGLGPKATLEKANAQLCENNEAEMFVTVWLGVLEISTGKLTYANAGHEHPAVQRAGGEYELVKEKHGFVLAGLENVRYQEHSLTLNVGDRLYLYTDGVAEATDGQSELYGTDRMLESLNRCRGVSCGEVLRRAKEDIDAFVGAAPQFDDITMLNLEMRGNIE